MCRNKSDKVIISPVTFEIARTYRGVSMWPKLTFPPINLWTVWKMEDNEEVKPVDTKCNLCDSCMYDMPVCLGEPEFGDGVGNDNVIKCVAYEEWE